MMTLTVPDFRVFADATGHLNDFLASAPAGSKITNPYALPTNGVVRIPKGIELTGGTLFRTLSYPWRIVPDLRATLPGGAINPAYHPTGRVCTWLYDEQGGRTAEGSASKTLGSLGNPYWNGTTNGGNRGGFSATDGTADGVWDGMHLTSRYGAPFSQADVGKAITMLTNSGAGAMTNNVISWVSPDGKTVKWGTQTPLRETGSHTVNWVINKRGAGWKIVFVLDPDYNPIYVSDVGWNGYLKAFLRMQALTNSAMVYVSAGAKISHMGLEGANTHTLEATLNWDVAAPLVTEFQHLIATADATSQVAACTIAHPWGDGESGPGLLAFNDISETGRQGCCAHFADKRIRGNTYHGQFRHHCIDIEGAQVPNVQITDNTFRGAKSPIAWSSGIDGFDLSRNITRQALIAAPGRGRALSTNITEEGNVVDPTLPY